VDNNTTKILNKRFMAITSQGMDQMTTSSKN